MDTYGRQVLVADVAHFAKKDCDSCYGLGYFVKIIDLNSKTSVACACALRRFHKKCSTDILVSSSDMRWKAGKAPPLC